MAGAGNGKVVCGHASSPKPLKELGPPPKVVWGGRGSTTFWTAALGRLHTARVRGWPAASRPVPASRPAWHTLSILLNQSKLHLFHHSVFRTRQTCDGTNCTFYLCHSLHRGIWSANVELLLNHTSSHGAAINRFWFFYCVGSTNYRASTLSNRRKLGSCLGCHVDVMWSLGREARHDPLSLNSALNLFM